MMDSLNGIHGIHGVQELVALGWTHWFIACIVSIVSLFHEWLHSLHSLLLIACTAHYSFPSLKADAEVFNEDGMPCSEYRVRDAETLRLHRLHRRVGVLISTPLLGYAGIDRVAIMCI